MALTEGPEPEMDGGEIYRKARAYLLDRFAAYDVEDPSMFRWLMEQKFQTCFSVSPQVATEIYDQVIDVACKIAQSTSGMAYWDRIIVFWQSVYEVFDRRELLTQFKDMLNLPSRNGEVRFWLVGLRQILDLK